MNYLQLTHWNTFGSMHHLSNKKKNRFAWLTPLSPEVTANGPWVLAENETYRYFEADETHCRKIPIDSLLLLAASVLTIPSSSSTETRDTWKSACGRYRVEWKKQQSDSSRLFVQQAEDYYARIELFIDDALLAAFHEPVWPHLQRAPLISVDRLIVPSACLDALEASASNTQRTCAAPDNKGLPGDQEVIQAA